MSTHLNFCPKCGSLLNVSKDEADKIGMTCMSCDYTRDIEDCALLHVNVIEDSSKGSLNYSMIYDSAVRRTANVVCMSEKCPSNDAKKWGTRGDNGILIQPDLMIINFNDVDRKSTYICRICGSTFQPSIKTKATVSGSPDPEPVPTPDSDPESVPTPDSDPVSDSAPDSDPVSDSTAATASSDLSLDLSSSEQSADQ